MSPTARTLALLRKRGLHAFVVERWIPQARKRIDVAGIGDILCFGQSFGIALVQCTTASNLSSRIHKFNSLLVENSALESWFRSGGRVLFYGWSMRGKRGERKLWGVTIHEGLPTGRTILVIET